MVIRRKGRFHDRRGSTIKHVPTLDLSFWKVTNEALTRSPKVSSQVSTHKGDMKMELCEVSANSVQMGAILDHGAAGTTIVSNGGTAPGSGE
jgi:hypothetical protein